jgi:hypothetical protein
VDRCDGPMQKPAELCLFLQASFSLPGCLAVGQSFELSLVLSVLLALFVKAVQPFLKYHSLHAKFTFFMVCQRDASKLRCKKNGACVCIWEWMREFALGFKSEHKGTCEHVTLIAFSLFFHAKITFRQIAHTRGRGSMLCTLPDQ